MFRIFASLLFYVINRAWTILLLKFRPILELFNCNTFSIVSFARQWQSQHFGTSSDRAIWSINQGEEHLCGNYERISNKTDNWLTQFGRFSIATYKLQLTYQIGRQFWQARSIILFSKARAKMGKFKLWNSGLVEH